MTRKTVVVIGGGVGGLISAYELSKDSNYNVIVIEAREKLGGRNVSVRLGESITEVDKTGNKVTHFAPKESDFKNPSLNPGEKDALYLNAGPGRIPSHHRNLFRYCKELGVLLEIYVKESRSNLLKLDGNDSPFINREITYDIRGYTAQYFANLIISDSSTLSPKNKSDGQKLLPWLKEYGSLDKNYKYNGSDRIGYKVLPSVEDGVSNTPLNQEDLFNALANIMGTNFYSVDEFVQQPTSFQCVGGNDAIIKKLHEKLQSRNNCKIYVNTPVKNIHKINKSRYLVDIDDTLTATEMKNSNCHNTSFVCDIIISNAPLPLVRDLINKDAQYFDKDFIECLDKMKSLKDDFMQPAFKVGWWSERKYWQTPDTKMNTKSKSNKLQFDTSGTVPIYGGTSWTDDKVKQIWYPSSGASVYDNYGVLTGAYLGDDGDASYWGNLKSMERLDVALGDLVKMHKGWTDTDTWQKELKANNYKKGISIAWHNIPHINMGWADWEKCVSKDTTEKDMIKLYNCLAKLGKSAPDEQFYIVGDQMSKMQGWMEGAVASAINAVNKIMDKSHVSQEVTSLPLKYSDY